MNRLNTVKYISGAAGLFFASVGFYFLDLQGVGIITMPTYIAACGILLFRRRWADVLSLTLFSGLFMFFAIGIANFCGQTSGNPDSCPSKVFGFYTESDNWLDLVYIAHVLATIALLLASLLRKREILYR